MGSQVHLGFLGLGQMGAPMAERLLADDVCLHVYDPAPAATATFVDMGAVRHDSPRSVADAATIVMASLPDGNVSEQVALGKDGVIAGNGVRVYVEMSTIGRKVIETISTGLAAAGIKTVDAPVTGGPPAVRAGTLTVMVSGDAADVSVASPWLGRIGGKVRVLGERVGQAQVMKLVNQLVMATNMVVASEGILMGAKAGLDPDLMMDVLNSGTGGSAAAADILAKFALPGRFDFGARLSIVEKDVGLGVLAARELDMSLTVIEQAAALWSAAGQEGYRDQVFRRSSGFSKKSQVFRSANAASRGFVSPRDARLRPIPIQPII